MFCRSVQVRRHVAELVDHRHDDAPVILPQQPVQRRDAVGVRHVAQAHRRQILEHLIFQLVAVDHQQDGRLLRLGRLEEQLRRLDHRVGLAAALRVPDEAARALRVERPRHHLVHRRRLMLAQDELLQFLLLLREEDEILQEAQQLRHGAEALHLGFEVADLLVLPVENVSPHRVPGHPVGEADGLRGGEDHLRHHHLRRLRVVAADLIHPERDRLVLARVLALDHQHRDAVDEEDHILPRAVVAVVDVELLRHLIHVAPLLARAGEVAVINQRQVQLAVLLGAEELP